MASTMRFLMNYNIKRCISSSSVNFSKSREGRFLKHMMVGRSNKSKWYEGQARIAKSPVMADNITSSHVTRRMTVLNKLFMQHITDLMATGEVSAELLGRGIEVTHVKITQDFRTVLVYWASKKSDHMIETMKVLKACAFKLRHELTQLRVIGQVPMIEFVKNKQVAELAELDKRINIADYGEDFEPTVVQYAPKTELSLIKSIPTEIRKKILELEDSIPEEEEDDSKYDVNIPPMRHDVLGLDRHAIMNRVETSLKKTQEGANKRFMNMTSIYPSESKAPLDLASFHSSKTDSKAFMDFLVKRQIEEKRKFRRENKERILEYHLRQNYESLDEETNDEKDDERDVDDFDDISIESFK